MLTLVTSWQSVASYRFIGCFQGWISSHLALQREDVKREEGTIGMEVGAARAAVGMILARPKWLQSLLKLRADFSSHWQV